MFFILSKVLFFLLVPLTWIIGLLLWMWLSKNPRVKKRLLTIAIFILIIFTNPYLYRTTVMAWQPQPVDLPKSKTYEAGIILGGLSGYDKNQRGHFGENADRFIQTANLYHQGIIKKIIISGGTGKLTQDEPAETVYLRTQFIANGVNDSDIINESRSRNTYENAVFSKKICDSLQLQPPFIVITSAFHMRRSMSVFKKAGYNCIPFPCDYKITPQKFSLEDTIIPAIGLLTRWSDIIKEMVGLTVYRLTGKA